MKKEQVSLKTLIISGVIFLIGYGIFLAVLIYAFGVNNQLTQKTEKFFLYPAAMVGVKPVSISEVDAKLSAVRMFYENQNFADSGMRVDFSTPDGKKRLEVKRKDILNKLIENKIIELEAKKRKIDTSRDEASQELTRKLQEYGSADYLKENISKLYGWDLADFQNNIVIPDLNREKLYKNIKETDPDFKVAKAKIDKALVELNNNQPFDAIAQKYSEGGSAKNGGDLGWFNGNQMLPEISSAAVMLDKGQRSEIIESSLGYHIVKVEDKKNENGQDSFKVRQVFVRTKTMAEWLSEVEKSYSIKIFIKGMFWNKETDDVEFNDPEMKRFEENFTSSPGDAATF